MTPTFSIRNIRLFIAFRVFFNSRFYYPVFTILFLDFGLTVAQFSILNAVWAATIVLAEVPSGALADIVGRKRLLVFATFVMIIEIGIISFVPRSHPGLIFSVFLVNRVLSGLAEAAASGADEAIAYDSLAQEGDKEQWGRVLEILTRFQSIGFIVAMTAGALIYDPSLMTQICHAIGFTVTFTQETTMRFPLYLTLVLAVCAFISTLRMSDPGGQSDTRPKKSMPLRQAFSHTIKAGSWILKTPFALSVILFGMLLDGIIRMVVTLSSQYYRMIELPEAVFGLIGSLVAFLGFIIPKIARNIAENKSSRTALMTTSLIAVTGLTTMSFFWPYWGLVCAIITFSAMYFNAFFVSFYINKVTSSEKRATVLSFKGLSYNIFYGFLGIAYAISIKWEKAGLPVTADIEDIAFKQTFFWFPATFIIAFILLYLIWSIWLKPSK